MNLFGFFARSPQRATFPAPSVWSVFLLLCAVMASLLHPVQAQSLSVNVLGTSGPGVHEASGSWSGGLSAVPNNPPVGTSECTASGGKPTAWSTAAWSWRTDVTQNGVSSSGLSASVNPASGSSSVNVVLGFSTPGTYHVEVFAKVTYTSLCSANVEKEGSRAFDVTVVSVDKIQYNNGSAWVDAPSTMYVLKGTTVNFKAIPNPNSSAWPTGKPVWSGSASGTSPTASVAFNTLSTSATDYKTVAAECGNTITVNIVVYQLSIMQDDYLDITTPNVSSVPVIVGQLNDLTAAVEPSGLTLSDFQWSIPGSIAHDWTHNTTSSLKWPIGSSQLTLQNIKFAWLDGGSPRTVSLTAKINGVAVPSVTAIFEVTKPSYGLTLTAGGEVGFSQSGSGWKLILGGGPSASNVGIAIAITGTPTSPEADNCQTWQIVTASSRRIHSSAGWRHWNIDAGPTTLDTADPYPKDYSTGTNTSSNDNPAITINSTDDEASVTESFSHYLLYMPTGSEHDTSIYVPLQVADWNWAAYVQKNKAGTSSDWDAGTTSSASGSTLGDIVNYTKPSSKTGSSTTTYPGGEIGWDRNIASGHYIAE